MNTQNTYIPVLVEAHLATLKDVIKDHQPPCFSSQPQTMRGKIEALESCAHMALQIISSCEQIAEADMNHEQKIEVINQLSLIAPGENPVMEFIRMHTKELDPITALCRELEQKNK
jgi:hypothetical protein